MSSQVAMLLLKMLSSEDGRNTLKMLFTALACVMGAFILLMATIVHILTYPIELVGSLGEFQRNYSYLITQQDPSSIGGGEALTDEQIEALVAAADTTDPDRLEILRTALSLVGRVPYFWGGKSSAGWNDEWNTLKQVTAPGVSSSGTLQPYGLDCSGFTDWVWRTAGFKSIGSGVHAQFWASELISEEELEPGDLVFKNWPDNKIINHVGIYYGKDADGKNLYIHCSSGAGGVVINGYSGFIFWGRPTFTREA